MGDDSLLFDDEALSMIARETGGELYQNVNRLGTAMVPRSPQAPG